MRNRLLARRFGQMKTIVIYTSQTGFTKRYAEWIAEAAGADCLDLSAAKKTDFTPYGAIVFGGWACAGNIRHIRWFKGNIGKWADKKLIAFCVGANPMDSPEMEAALKRNFSASEQKKVKAFYCPGGLNYAKMSAPSKFIMKILVKALKAKKDKTEEEQLKIKMISSSYDISDKKYIEPILRCLKE